MLNIELFVEIKTLENSQKISTIPIIFSLSMRRLSQQALCDGISILLCSRWCRNDRTPSRTSASTSNPFPTYWPHPSKGPHAIERGLTWCIPREGPDTQEMLLNWIHSTAVFSPFSTSHQELLMYMLLLKAPERRKRIVGWKLLYQLLINRWQYLL